MSFFGSLTLKTLSQLKSDKRDWVVPIKMALLFKRAISHLLIISCFAFGFDNSIQYNFLNLLHAPNEAPSVVDGVTGPGNCCVFHFSQKLFHFLIRSSFHPGYVLPSNVVFTPDGA